MWPLLINNKTQPANAITTPKILFWLVWVLKNKAPIIITKMGVRQLSMPASELSISFSAMQNKNDGIRLPNKPDKKTYLSLATGILRNELIATGNSTKPADTILIDAI